MLTQKIELANHESRLEGNKMAQKKLVKSTKNVWVSGVFAGIGEYFGWGPTAITAMRIVFIILTVASYGILMFVYIFVSMRMKKPDSMRKDEK